MSLAKKKKSEFFDKDDIVEFCRILVPLMMMMEMFISIIVVLSCLLWLLRWMDDEPTPGEKIDELQDVVVIRKDSVILFVCDNLFIQETNKQHKNWLNEIDFTLFSTD